MRIVVFWESPSEESLAGRVADAVRRLLRTHLNIAVTPTSAQANYFAPFRNDAESLAVEAQRLLDAQEVAFGDKPDPQPLGFSGPDADTLSILTKQAFRQRAIIGALSDQLKSDQ